MDAALATKAWADLLASGSAGPVIKSYAQHRIDELNRKMSAVDLTDNELRSIAAHIAVWMEIKQHTEAR